MIPRPVDGLLAASFCLLVLLVAHTGPGLGGLSSYELAGHPLFDHWVYNALILGALATVVARVLLVRTELAAWISFAAALASWATGELLFDFVYDGNPPFPSAADGFYLGFYPACFVGLALLLRSRISTFNRSLWLDGITAALAAAALAAALLVEVVVATTAGRPVAVVTNLAYPLGDVLLIALVVSVFVRTGWRPGRAWSLILFALTATFLADAIYLFQASTDTYVEGTPLDALWPLSMLLLALAAWQPASRPEGIELHGRPLFGTPAACGLLALGVLVYASAASLNWFAVVLAGATVVVVLARTALTFRENTTLLTRARAEAVTDALTGLGNRRRFLADLDRFLDGEATPQRLLVLFDLDGFKYYNDTFGHPAGDALLVRLGGRLAAVGAAHGASYRLGGDEFCLLVELPEGGADALTGAAVAALSDSGDGFSISTSFGAVLLPAEAARTADALRVADQRLYAQKNAAKLGRGRPHEVLLQALREREPALYGHSRQVAQLSVAVGREMGLPADVLERIKLAAELHDIGKLGIPDEVLKKPGTLTEEEWSFVRQHTVIGQRILAAAPALHEVGAVVRSTHERWDGKGYPDGLVGEQISLEARIVAVCDAFTAMTAQRPYAAGVAPGEVAIRELRRCAGAQFDPAIVPVLCRVVEAEPPVERLAG